MCCTRLRACNHDRKIHRLLRVLLTCGCEPPPARSAGPGLFGAPPDSAGSSDLQNRTAPGGTPAWTARWSDPAAAGWTCTGSRRLPPAAAARRAGLISDSITMTVCSHNKSRLFIIKLRF